MGCKITTQTGAFLYKPLKPSYIKDNNYDNDNTNNNSSNGRMDALVGWINDLFYPLHRRVMLMEELMEALKSINLDNDTATEILEIMSTIEEN